MSGRRLIWNLWLDVELIAIKVKEILLHSYTQVNTNTHTHTHDSQRSAWIFSFLLLSSVVVSRCDSSSVSGSDGSRRKATDRNIDDRHDGDKQMTNHSDQ